MACGSLLRSVSCEDTQLHNELSMSKTFQSKEFVVLYYYITVLYSELDFRMPYWVDAKFGQMSREIL